MTEILDSTKYDIEELIDAFGLKPVLGAIADICMEKSDHIRSNGMPEDVKLAKIWKNNSVKLTNLITIMGG